MLRKKLKILLVHSPCPELEEDRLEPPLGILYLATKLQDQKRISASICDLSGVPEDKWQENLEEADVYAFSTYSVTYHRTLKIRDLAKEINPKALTIAGGPHVSALPEESISDFDIIIVGEAEIVLSRLIETLPYWRSKKMLKKGIFMGEPVKNLDLLPFPNYDLVNRNSYSRIVEGRQSISIISSRGCPYKCAFCNSLVFKRGDLRFRSSENVAREISFLQEKYGINNFRFNDDLFTYSPERTKEITRILKPLNIHYRIFSRSGTITEETAEMLYQSGCRHVAIGVESMSQKMLDVMYKKITIKNNFETIKFAKKAGLKVRIYLIVGFPGETEDTFEESLTGLLKCDFDEFTVYPFIPYPGTSVWEDPAYYGAEIVNRNYSNYVQVGRDRSTCYAIKTKDFIPEKVEVWRLKMIEKLEKNGFVWTGKSKENK